MISIRTLIVVVLYFRNLGGVNKSQEFSVVETNLFIIYSQKLSEIYKGKLNISQIGSS